MGAFPPEGAPASEKGGAMESFYARCRRDGTRFMAVPRPYPSKEHQGDGVRIPAWQVTCPTCGRVYFPNPKNGVWYSDRPLEVLQKV